MRVIYISLLFIICECGKSKVHCTNEKDIIEVAIKKVDFEITSIVHVDCENFEQYFKSDIVDISISDKKTIENLKRILDSLEPDKENYQPDIRAKIIIHHSDHKIDTVCMSDIGILVNGKSFLKNEALVDFVSTVKGQ